MRKVNLDDLGEFLKEETPKKKENISKATVSDVDKKIKYGKEVIATAVKMIYDSSDGNKHRTLTKASYLLGGHIPDGILSESEAITALRNVIDIKPNVANKEHAYKTIEDCLKKGMDDPITLENLEANKQEYFKQYSYTNYSVPPEISNEEPIIEEKKVVTPLLPIDGLPDFLQNLITNCTEVYGTHRDFWVGAFLAATAIGIGQTQQLMGKYTNASVLWLALSAPSGVGKTEPLTFAFKPFHLLDLESIKIFEIEFREYERIKSMNKAAKKEEGIISDPEIPLCKQYILTDATPEALTKAHKSNIRGVNIERDELHGWLLDIGRYSKSGEVQNMLSSWSQKTFTVNRVEGAPKKILHPFINITGGIQPDIIPELAKDHRAVNGFMQRFCFVYPDEAIRPEYSSIELSDELKEKYAEYIGNLLKLTGYCEKVYLSNAAQSIYETFVNKNTKLINAEKIDYLKALYAKLDVISLRFALIIHFAKWACTSVDEPSITPETMQSAIDITEYFRITGLKVFKKLNMKNGGLNNKSVASFLNDKGASQNEIAKVLHVSQPYVNKLLKS